jgi:hypothetical protein
MTKLRRIPLIVFLEGEPLVAGIDHRITGDANTGALTVSLGYRFVL